MKRLLASLSMILVAALPSLASGQAASETFTYSGYLKQANGSPEVSSVTVTFTLWDAATGGSAKWVVQKSFTPDADGYFSVTLGDSPTFASQNVDFGQKLYLGMKVGTDTAEMSPRALLGAAPRALSVDWFAIDGRPALCPTGLSSGVNPTTGVNECFDSSACTSGQTLKWNGSTWGCAADNNTGTTYTAGNGLNLAAGAFVVSSPTCAAGEFSKWNGTAWTCAAPAAPAWGSLTGFPAACGAGTVLSGFTSGGLPTCVADATGAAYSAGANGGLTLASGAFSITSTGCTAGQVLTFVGPGWGCTTPASAGVASFALRANGGLVNTGTATDPVVGLASTCTNNQLLKWNSTTSAWGCGDDNNTGTTYTAGNGLNLATGAFAIASPTCAAGEYSRWTGSTWACATPADTNTTYGAGAGLSLTAGNFVVNSPTCAVGEVSRWNGTAWTCVAQTVDTNTTYGATVGGGLTLTGTNFGLSTACGDGQILKMVGGLWTCSVDAGGTGTVTDVLQAANPIAAVANAGVAVTTSGSTRTVGLKACAANNQILKFDATNNIWSCQADADTTYGAGNGLALTTGNFVISSPTCTAGQVSKWSGATWTCVADADTTYSNGAGLLLAGTVFSANLTASGGDNGTATTVARGDHVHSSYATAASVTALGAAGTINTGTNPLDWTKLKNVPAGIADGVDADTTYWPLVGGGLKLTGQAFGIDPTGCNNGYVMKFDGFNWACALDANDVYTAGTGVTITGNSVAASFTTSGGDNGVNGLVARGDHLHDGRYYTETELNTNVVGGVNAAANPVDWTKLKSVPAGFADGIDADSGGTVTSVTPFAGGAIEVLGDATQTPSIGLALCGQGQVLKYFVGIGWGCDVDNDTIYKAAAGGGLALDASNQFSIASGGVSTAMIADGTITAVDLASQSVTTAKIANCAAVGQILRYTAANTWSCVTETVNAAGAGLSLSSGTMSIPTGGVTSSMILDGSVAGADIADGSIAAADLAAGSVTLAKIAACTTAGQILKWDGAAWTCGVDIDTNTSYSASSGVLLTGTTFSANLVTPTGGDAGSAVTVARGDHLHDGRYFTETELNSAGTINTAANPLEWSKLKNVPAGIADGVDADTTYSAGTGLTLTGTQFSINTTATQARVTGTCNQGISAISATGSVTCEPTNPSAMSWGNATPPIYSTATNNFPFIGATPAITVDGTQSLLIVSSAALGSTSVGGGTGLRLSICYRLSGDTTSPTSVSSSAVYDLTVPQNQRQLFTLSARVQPPAGTYYVGLCGYTNVTPVNWNNNEWSYTSVISIN
jgi:hypothetical protein